MLTIKGVKAYLVKSSVSQFEDIYHANNLACITHYGQVQVVTIYK
jgi:hypothetical protein